VSAALLAGLVAGYGVALPVGAVATYLVGLSARNRFPTAAAAALGVATTDACYALVAVVGGVGLASILRPVAAPLTDIAACLLLVLAARTFVAARRRYRDPLTTKRPDAALSSPLRAYGGLVLLTSLNPTTILYFAALAIGSHGDGATQTLGAGVGFVAGVFVASASWQLFLASVGAVLGRAITSGRGQLIIAMASAAIVVALATDLLAR
jgi:arginine exporter protein ArgO